MPAIAISEGFITDPFLVIELLERTFDFGTLDSGSSDGNFAVFDIPPGTSATLTFIGSGFTFDDDGSGDWIATGTIAGFIYELQPGYTVTVTGLSLSASDLADMRAAELADPTGSMAVESFFNSDDWDIYGNSNGETFYRAVGDDGSYVRLTGDDYIFAGRGRDTVYGAAGNDFIKGGPGQDLLRGDSGDDIVNGGAGADTVFGGTGTDLLRGGRNNDKVHGGDGRDFLHGGSGDDSLFGGNGDDVIFGDAGDDFLKGGQGYDEFRFRLGDGNDTIEDFDVALDNLKFIPGGTVTATIQGDDTLIACADVTVLLLDVHVQQADLGDILIN